MQFSVAMKKVEGQFEATLIVDNKFNRSATAKSPREVVTKLLGATLGQEYDEGTSVEVAVLVMTAAEVARQEARARRQRETAEAKAEADELENLNKELRREQAARDAQTPMMAGGPSGSNQTA